MLIALGIDDKGKREVLGVQVSLSEAEVYWREFLGDLQKRGMHGTKLIISDAHSSIKAARKAIMPGVAWQRYQLHLQQNAQAYVTKQSKKRVVAADIRAVFNAPSANEAKRQLDLLMINIKTVCQSLPSGLRIISLKVNRVFSLSFRATCFVI
ncbi:hypothetical protein BSPWISOXPB_399 [uncultured Gammaproteobacteria bacterium]|nr:hypothetical protein BSPWISOXPB_399 [uncultured Gammaproteobacteria bacterium]